jgi:putative DNA methylase
MSTQHSIKMPKKLIEVALPLDSINLAARDEKAVPRPGHPQTMHYWWARRPLAAARSVIFAQMVNDPSWKWELEHPGEIPPNNLKASWAATRKRLFSILEDLAKWENTTNEDVLGKARAEIHKSWREACELNRDHPDAETLFNPEKLPGFHDPFAGGGALPLEAQRLGLESHASDLNPVAVLINKAMIEIPPKFAGHAPVNPDTRAKTALLERTWKHAQGLAEDVRYYGKWMRDEAQNRIGYVYPAVEVTADMASERPDLRPLIGQRLTVVAWLWARTVKSPNPAFRHVDVPLASSFILSIKKGKEAYVQPVLEGDHYHFTVKMGRPPDEATNGTKSGGSGSTFTCLLSQAPMDFAYIRGEAKRGRMGQKLLAIVTESQGGRVYLSPTKEAEAVALGATPAWAPSTPLPAKALGFRVQEYGMAKWADLFTSRQLVALTTFSDLLIEARQKIQTEALAAGLPDDERGPNGGGVGAKAYAEAITVYLGCALSRLASYNNTICHWNLKGGSVALIFARQAVPMSWDFIEVAPLQKMSGNWIGGVEWVSDVFDSLEVSRYEGSAVQADASTQVVSRNRVVSTDPPYYDNIGYADLSDFFYVWLRPSQKHVFPELFATVAVPKEQELIASPFRHGTRDKAEVFFLAGMTNAMQRLANQTHPAFPVTIYYAFKQSESRASTGTASTGWETFLEAVIRSGFAVTGTWPMRTEKQGRMTGYETNALASSIVLVCRPRPANVTTTSRRAFLRELNEVLPAALDEMTKGTDDTRSPVAPVDLSQAIIGPGMAVYSKYAAVLEADGTPMSVQTALRLINRFLAEDDFDHDTQFCLHWFEQHGWKDGKFGDADTLARAKGTSVDGVKQANVVYASGGIVRLLKWSEYPADWDPENDPRLPVWEALHHLIRVFNSDGESGAGSVLAGLQASAEATRQLAYRLYTLCERAGWADDARAYNEIITSWSAIESAASAVPTPKQTTLFG